MKGHINGKLISHMLIDGGAIVNLMPYSVFKKLGKEDEGLIKTNMTVTVLVEVILLVPQGCLHGVDHGGKTLATAFFVSVVQGNFSLIWDVIGFMQINVFLIPCTSSRFSGLVMR